MCHFEVSLALGHITLCCMHCSQQYSRQRDTAAQDVCDCYLTRPCGMLADLELFITECGALRERCARETMKWRYLEGASSGLDDIFAPHR